MMIAQEPKLRSLLHNLQMCLDDLATELKLRVAENHNLHALRVRSDGDTTHSFDKFAEDAIIGTLTDSHLNIEVMSEESDKFSLGTGGDYIAIVDPVDGSDMVAHGYPLASSAICLVDSASGEPVLSIVSEVFTGVQYTAFDGVAARNGKPIKPSQVAKMEDAFIVSYAATKARRDRTESQDIFTSTASLFLNYGGPLDIAKVGSGQCDAVIEMTKGFPPRDLAPGLHIASCAGAVTLDLDSGTDLKLSSNEDSRLRFVVAANPELLEDIGTKLHLASYG